VILVLLELLSYPVVLVVLVPAAVLTALFASRKRKDGKK
jgi:hypothetical protein